MSVEILRNKYYLGWRLCMPIHLHIVTLSHRYVLYTCFEIPANIIWVLERSRCQWTSCLVGQASRFWLKQEIDRYYCVLYSSWDSVIYGSRSPRLARAECIWLRLH